VELREDEVVEQLDLKALVGRASRSDPAAWEALYERAYARLIAYAKRRLPSGSEADDAVSETFARAYERITRFRWKRAGFDAWLYGILRNVILEILRARGRESPPSGVERPNPAPGPLERVLADEEAREVRSAFARLSPEDQEVLELRVVGELDASEVAMVLGKRAGAVRMAQSRALGRLRALMKGGEA
jgi:RNA polymerase sigma-70 factor (ECF subfamily)